MQRLRFWRGRPFASWRPFVGGFVLGGAAVLGVGVIVVAPWLLTHHHNLPLEEQFGHYAVSVAARLHAGGKTNPMTANRQTLERGQYAYTGSCAQCHGPTGNGKGGVLSGTLYPPATDLTKGDAKEKSDAELFWITKNGLSFTAMPGFSDQYNDDTIWAIVAYLRALQGTQGSTPRTLTVPTPSAVELARANPSGDAAARGAAVYFAQSCEKCHGGSGNASGELRLRLAPDNATIACQIRNGPNGMPAYSSAQISDAEMGDLITYLRTLPGTGQPDAERAGSRPSGGTSERPRQEGERNGAPEGDRQAFSSPPGSDTSACAGR